MNLRKLGAELLGTFWLVLGGCGTAVLAGKTVGTLGVALAFGLTVLTGAYALGPISGGHFNPAVTLGFWIARRFPARDVVPYIVAQCLGACCGAGIIAVIANGQDGFDIKASGFAANGFGSHSPGHYKAGAAFVCELVLTAMFVLVILGATHGRATTAAAPLAIGLALTLVHLISIPVTNTSVNPARSLSQAIYVQDWALKQLWLFWLAPIAGAILAALVWSAVWDRDDVAAPSPVPAASNAAAA